MLTGWVIYSGKVPLEWERGQQNAAAAGIELKMIDPALTEICVDDSRTSSIYYDGSKAAFPDFLYLSIMKDHHYNALALMLEMEKLNIPCVNPQNAVLAANDKFLSCQILSRAKLPFPKTILVNGEESIPAIKDTIGFPAVLKILTGAKGSGVIMVKTEEECRSILQLLHATAPGTNMIAQEFIKESSGKDLRVIVVDGKAIACMCRKAHSSDFRANFSLGGSVEDYPMTEEIKTLGIKAAEALGLRVAGVDLLFTAKGFTICEINASPGFAGIESCCPVNVSAEIFKLAVILVREKKAR
ncbi:MAG: hypothetical protein A2020_12395 [Lentisphaerae bacterium GWF2_45_14]|nr:MAG: hypothetical protein A2020_12395 [Lentisphaerae bacterium GWF2_45_14]